MGRKIPGRKHKGVRDPEKQAANRFEKIKDKINDGPSNPDDQEIPKSLTKLIEIRNKVKQGLFNKKKKKDRHKENINEKKHFKGRPEKAIPKFEQLPGEAEWEFKRRVNRICSEFLREAAFENKYNIDVKRNEAGKVEGVVKRPKDELETLVKKLRKEKKSKTNKKGNKKKDSQDAQPKLTKSQKWALKKAEKKKKKESDKSQDYDLMPQKEQVMFGEIVHAPPTLVTPKYAEKIEGAPRPGQKQLLLKSVLSNGSNNKSMQLTDKQSKYKNRVSDFSKTINKKGKRKDLPHALRRQLDKQQKEIIDAYKTLKSKKYSNVLV